MGQGITSQAALLEMLRVQAAAAAHVDELVTTAQRWLYDRCRLIPGQRQITDMARHAFSAYKAQMLAAVNRAVPAATLQHCMESVRSPRADGSATHLEWIKAPSRVEFCHRPRLDWLALQRLPRSCMATVERTAYPRFPKVFSTKELQACYTLDAEELEWVTRSTRGQGPRLGLLVLLKVFQ